MAAGTAVKAPAEYRFTVNGEEQVVTTDKPLLRYLRDELHLTSVKDGCSEGACGTCTVLVDDVATRACVLTTELAQGRDATKTLLKDNPELCEEIEAQIMKAISDKNENL